MADPAPGAANSVNARNLLGSQACREYLRASWHLLSTWTLASIESNDTFSPGDWENAPLRALIVRLSPLRDVELSSPHLILYEIARRASPDCFVDFSFLPTAADRAILAEAGMPFIFGAATGRPASDFDVLLVSNSFTLELINLPFLLLHSGIRLFTEERDEQLPLVILGGSNALAAGAVAGARPMVDALFFGEAEEEGEKLVRLLAATPRSDRRRKLPAIASEVRGLWIPGSSLPVRKAILRNPAGSSPHLLPVLNTQEAGTARLTMSYGCPCFCSFCFEGYERKPYRELPLDFIMNAARLLKRRGGATADLASFNFNTHSRLFALMLALHRLFRNVNYMSQRIDILSSVPGLVEVELAAGKRSFTLGIEGISERWRAFYHKSLATAQIEEVLTALIARHAREAKLFYILSGREDEKDIDELAQFLDRLNASCARESTRMRIVLSFGFLVRMPFTPLQYDSLCLDGELLERLAERLKAVCDARGLESRLAASVDEYVVTQLLALGDGRLAEGIALLASKDICYDGRLRAGTARFLSDWMAAHGLLTAELLGEKDEEYLFPFGEVEAAAPGFLYSQFKKAKSLRDDGYCLANHRCIDCGGCELPDEKRAILHHTIGAEDPRGVAAELSSLSAAKQHLARVFVVVSLPSETSGALMEWREAYVARKLIECTESLSDLVLEVQEILVTAAAEKSSPPGFFPWYGETVIAIATLDPGATLELLRAARPVGLSLVRLFGPEGVPDSHSAGLYSTPRAEAPLPVSYGFEVFFPAGYFPDAEQRLQAFLVSEALTFSFRRLPAGKSWTLDLSPKALKKKSLLSCKGERLGDALRVELSVSPKFPIGSLIRSCAPSGAKGRNAAYRSLARLHDLRFAP